MIQAILGAIVGGGMVLGSLYSYFDLGSKREIETLQRKVSLLENVPAVGGSTDEFLTVGFGRQRLSGSGIASTDTSIGLTSLKQPVSGEDHALGKDEIADRWARRSLYAIRDIPAGSLLTEDMIITLRPWGGIAPKDAGLVIGKKVLRAIKARAPIMWEDFLETK